MLFHCWVHAVACTARRWRIELRRVLQVGDESKVELLDETLGAFLVGQMFLPRCRIVLLHR